MISKEDRIIKLEKENVRLKLIVKNYKDFIDRTRSSEQEVWNNIDKIYNELHEQRSLLRGIKRKLEEVD